MGKASENAHRLFRLLPAITFITVFAAMINQTSAVNAAKK